MKLPHLPFFWRLFSAFVICSLIPLFVLAFVVTGVFQQVITRHNELQKKNIIEQIAAITEQSVLEAKQTAITMAASPLITEYCLSAVQNNLFHEAKQSILISDIFQHIRLIEVSGKPTMLKLGIPLLISTSTVISIPSKALFVALIISIDKSLTSLKIIDHKNYLLIINI